MDWFSKLLGAGMILMTLYVLAVTRPPLDDAARQALWPERWGADVQHAVITLIGGTIGGYIMFSGAHRLLDGGVRGVDNLGLITRASVQGIVITGVMRTILFLAMLGIVSAGVQIGGAQPVFDAFYGGVGETGLLLAGLIFWAAAITSVVGCSYTAMSFVRLPLTPRQRSWLIVGFALASLAGYLLFQTADVPATEVLIFAGTLNGVLLPIVLGVVLAAAYSRRLMGTYRHPWWAGAFGVLAWLATLYMAATAVQAALARYL
jgi:Mn2+/Fe2+ NRAMP family transporter